LGILGRRISTEVLVVEADLVLLGRRDVFAAFQFGFDDRAKLLLIEPYDEAKDARAASRAAASPPPPSPPG
jgi:hypothetical protein